MTAKRDLLRLLRAVASPHGKDTAVSSAIHALGASLARCGVATPHTASRAARGALWTLGRTTSVQAQHGLSTACRAQGTSQWSRLDRFKLKIAYSPVDFRAPAAAAHYSFSTPSPDDDTPTHAPRHRACFIQTTVLLEPRNIRYPIRNTHAKASSSCTSDRYMSPCAHHRLKSREAARGFPAVCVRTITDGVEARSGRL